MTSPSSKQPPTPGPVLEATVVDVSAETPTREATAHEPSIHNVKPRDRDAVTVDINPSGSPSSPAPTPAPSPSPNQSDSSLGGGLVVARKGSFKSLLAPLKRDTFKQVVSGVEAKLGVVNQTLSMLDVLDDSQGGFEAVLEEMLESISLKTGELLSADRTTIYLLDEERNELWSKVAKGAPELRFPATVGIAGEVATFRRAVNIPYDFYDDPRSAAAKKFDQQNHYRTYTMLVMPLLNEHGDLVAVVQLINKLKRDLIDRADLALDDKIDLAGFTEDDEQVFLEFAPSIRLILESSKAFYAAVQRQRAATALMKATEALSKSSLDLEETLANVMNQAKELMQADRSTLWLLDDVKEELWTKIPIQGQLMEYRIPVDGTSFAAQVARSRQPLLIPFDLYDHPDSETSQETDRKSGYRTCSMLCMPVFNSDGALIGVTQLINKKRQGDYGAYDPNDWPHAPECWKASFNRGDQDFMETFNIQAGVALQNAKLFAEVKQQEQMQKDILRSLSDGVISTDRNGRIIAANERAKELLGLAPEDVIEGLMIAETLRIKDKEESQAENRFSQWLGAALSGDERNRQQYYPDQTLLPSLLGGSGAAKATPAPATASAPAAAPPAAAPGDLDDLWAEAPPPAPEPEPEPEPETEHSVNLSLNSIADATDPTQVRGALIVMEDISDEKRLKSTMYRYMTQELAEQLLASGETKMGGDRKEVSVLFSDIRSYTTLTESMTAEEVVAMLNEYFESMVDAVFKHKGTLDKYIGDAIMAVFGSPLPLEDHAWMAVQTAVDMRHRLVDFNNRRISMDKSPISIGIGLHSDEVISGNIGSSRRMEFTAIGDGVNLGSRLEGATKQYGCDILISESTYLKCGPEKLWARELDFIKVKGKNRPVSVYEVVGIREGDLARPIADSKIEILGHYAEGRKYYLNRQFALAMGEFARVMEIDHGDKAASLQLSRCQHYLTTPPSEEWDGAFTMTTK
ncbi:MAG: GAF domain-containing protein [Cyanobacteria bacterium]|nr:GAF domain-containing protein [Cyanobacteriota bacterium]